MANLKGVDADQIVALVRDAERDAISAIHHRASQAVDEVRTAVKALSEMPKGVPELLEHAVVVQSRDFTLPEYGGGQFVFRRVWFDHEGSGNSSRTLSDNDMGQSLPRGRYRALFFLLPLKD